jgi:hypothetical protein
VEFSHKTVKVNEITILKTLANLVWVWKTKNSRMSVAIQGILSFLQYTPRKLKMFYLINPVNLLLEIYYKYPEILKHKYMQKYLFFEWRENN